MERKIDIPHYDETIAWLLESQTPSIRYLTLTRILGATEKNEEVKAVRRLIPTSQPAKSIIEAQDPGGWWFDKRYYYGPKYQSAHWSLLLLSEMGLEPQHPAFRKGARFMLEHELKSFNDLDYGAGCFWGNWLRYQLYAGNQSHPRVQAVIERSRKDLMLRSKCMWNGNLPCAWGTARNLFGLALIPEAERSPELQQAIQAGLHFLLDEYDLVKADYPNEGNVHTIWSRVNFPLFYQADILFTLRVLKEYQALEHPNAQRAMDWLMGKRTKSGAWRGANPFSSRTWAITAEGERAERWTTLQAMEVFG